MPGNDSVIFFLLFYVILYASLVSCATLPIPQYLSRNFTDFVDTDRPASASESSLNASKLHTSSRQAGKCGKPPRWMNPLFHLADCEAALDWLYLEEMDDLQSVDYEFLSPRTIKVTKLRTQQTPRTYTFPVVMVDHFNDKLYELPGKPSSNPPGRPNDVASWRSIYYSAAKMIKKCIDEEQTLGWARTGMVLFSEIDDQANLIRRRITEYAKERLRTWNRNLCMGEKLKH
ncbi:hypothetical protein ACLMJK_001316 [Lecanora helva]